MPRVGFEPTTPVFVRAKTVHALARAATVICTLPKPTKFKTGDLTGHTKKQKGFCGS
jgi:hypothetical protein